MRSVKVAVIGLGAMGQGVARSLLSAGVDVTGCELSLAGRERFAAFGGRAEVEPAATAADADAVVVMVVNAVQAEAVLFGDKGAAAAMRQGGVILSCVTMAPDDARRLAARAGERGLLYLDAPVSGGAAKAAAGKLTVMASGSPAAFDAARPVLSAMAETVHQLGDEAGLGASYKMINQLLAGVHIAVAAEAIALGSKLGLDLATVYKVITASAGNSWMFENRVPHILDGDYTPLSAVSIFTKDLGIVSAIGHKEQFPLPIATTALQMFLATAAAGMAADDDASVARMIARVTGIDLPESRTTPNKENE